MSTDRPEQQLPIDTVEEALYVDIEHPVVAPATLARRAHGIDCRAAGPIVPIVNPRQLASIGESVDAPGNVGPRQAYLARFDRTVPVAGNIGSRSPGAAPSIERAAPQVSEAPSA